jgi:multiple RNA-binding domain-containing protein 1
LKRKRENPEAKLSEFIGVMGAKKSKTWQNEKTEDLQPTVEVEDSDDDMQVIGQEAELVLAPKATETISDKDWLKSKAKVLDDSRSANAETVDADTLETETHAAETLTGTSEKESLPNDPAEQILQGGRLYLRNLPFNATEDEIRIHFGQFGQVEEASLPISFYLVVMNYLIGTSDACS